MLALTIGYTATGPTADPTVLYCGRDASAANALSLAPPAGIIRTEFYKSPTVVRRRSFPENLAPAAATAEPQAKAKPAPKPAAATD